MLVYGKIVPICST